MFKTDFAIYLGKELADGYTGFIVEKNFFFTLSIKNITAEEGRNFLSKIKNDLLEKNLNNLNDFENFIAENIKQANLPTNFSISAGFLKNNILYLKTINEGKIYLYRASNLVTLIEGNLSASGFLKENDLLIFTQKSFSDFFNGEKKLQDFLNKNNPSEIVDSISPLIKGKNDEGLIALFIRFLKNDDEIELTKEETLFSPRKFNIFEKLSNRINALKNDFILYSQKTGKRKIITVIVVFLIFLIFLWSVVFGVKRRRLAIINRKIDTVEKIIENKLSEAEESAFFNLKQAQISIEEAKKELENLEKEVGKNERVDKIKIIIRESENKIVKKEEKEPREFFDLAIDNPQASGVRLFLNNENLYILDTKNATIYLLSLTKKSLEKKSKAEIKEANFIAASENKIFFFSPDTGVYEIENENKIKKVIEKDENWGEIVDFWVYNNNLYLLDKDKSEIYKYVPTESGYSEKISYFKGGGQSLSQAVSMAIDLSIYVALPNQIFKFTAGEQEDFKVNFPDEAINIKKIYTNKNLEKLFIWDKEKGVIYILNKNGSYERQLASEIIKKATDFVVFENNVYLLSGGKIYQLEL